MTHWTDDELKELEDSENWDWENIEDHTPSPDAQAVVSVPFRADDFRLIASAARGAGVHLIDFIHQAAVEKAQHHNQPARSMTA